MLPSLDSVTAAPSTQSTIPLASAETLPPTKAVGESWRKDLYTEEGVEAARENRQRTNDTIRSAVGRHAHFIDPSSYECQSGCAGIHLPVEVANSFVSDMASHFVSDPYSFLLA